VLVPVSIGLDATDGRETELVTHGGTDFTAEREEFSDLCSLLVVLHEVVDVRRDRIVHLGLQQVVVSLVGLVNVGVGRCQFRVLVHEHLVCLLVKLLLADLQRGSV